MKNSETNDTFYSTASFLANTLHEIRTPIQTITASLELLHSTPLDKEQLEYLHQIQVSADVLLALANDVLDFTKIRSKGFQLEIIPFDIRQLVEKVTDFVSIESFNKGLEIVTDIEPSVPRFTEGDPTRIHQILLNMVKNAVKFTEKGYIRICVEQPSEKNLLFKVEDSGIGIPDDAKSQLFKDFFQVDRSTTRKYGGTGLGLSICKSLVTAMKGEIGVTGNPAGGSIFWFTIPYVETVCAANDDGMDSPVPPNTKILIVDDNFLARKSFERKLLDFGVSNVSTASNGDDALEMMALAAQADTPFTIVFIDMIMPKMDGWRLATLINADRQINNVKLYLTVPEGQMGQEAKMKMLNWFNGYLYKPVKRTKLKKLLATSFSESIELKEYEQINKKDSTKLQPPASTGELIALGVKILVAEDHPVNRKLTMSFLNRFGAEVFQAEDGQKAVEIAMEHPELDIIFMDIQMPRKNGIDATKELRSAGFGGVIVACSANNDTPSYELFQKSGMNDVLPKPFKSGDIKKVILKWKNAFSTSLHSPLTENVEHSPESVVWDEKDFEDTISQNHELGIQLIEDFEEQTAMLIKSVPASIEKKDFEELRRIGHTLKGSAATISAISISKHGERLNKAAHAQDTDELLKELDFISAEFRKFSEISQIWKEKHGSNNEDELSYSHDFL